MEKKKKRGNTNNTLASGSITFAISKKKSKTTKKSTAAILAEEELKHRVFKFVNNASLPTNILASENFRDMLDFALNKSKDLEDYQHMGNRKHIRIQFKSFTDFLEHVKSKVEKLRKWCKKITVSSYILCLP